MENGNNNNFYITILILLCTSLIILTNYVSSKNSQDKLFNKIMQTEYNKIGGKDNYELLKELQKKEILSYLETLQSEKPELIDEIKNKIKAQENNNYFLEKNSIEEIKKDSQIIGNSGALISIIEYSDFECEYCIQYHNSNILKNILKENKNINYIFKNFPLPINKNSKIIAESTECIRNLNNGSGYIDYIDKIFSNTKGGGEGLKLEKLNNFTSELGLNNNEFKKCLESNKYSEKIDYDFNYGIKLGINSVPSTIILNNKTGEYVLLKEKVEKNVIDTIILNFLN